MYSFILSFGLFAGDIPHSPTLTNSFDKMSDMSFNSPIKSQTTVSFQSFTDAHRKHCWQTWYWGLLSKKEKQNHHLAGDFAFMTYLAENTPGSRLYHQTLENLILVLDKTKFDVNIETFQEAEQKVEELMNTHLNQSKNKKALLRTLQAVMLPVRNERKKPKYDFWHQSLHLILGELPLKFIGFECKL